MAGRENFGFSKTASAVVLEVEAEVEAEAKGTAAAPIMEPIGKSWYWKGEARFPGKGRISCSNSAELSWASLEIWAEIWWFKLRVFFFWPFWRVGYLADFG